MRGDVVIYLVAFVFMILFVSLFFAVASGKTANNAPDTSAKEIKNCNTDNDCTNDAGGIRCMMTYPGNFVPFCGCLTRGDCLSGSCGSNNRCS